ncbi:MAG: sulfatase-like hydrolase/transferase [Tissierellia bacterium]|nr:sulfatase-like hydrolase/transferase [Tissierellia bacterium]
MSVTFVWNFVRRYQRALAYVVLPVLLMNWLFYSGTFLQGTQGRPGISLPVLLASMAITSIIEVLLLSLWDHPAYGWALLIPSTALKIALSLFYKEFGNLDLLARAGQAGEVTGVLPVLAQDFTSTQGLMVALLILMLIHLATAHRGGEPLQWRRLLSSLTLVTLLIWLPPIFQWSTFGVELYSTVQASGFVRWRSTQRMEDPKITEDIAREYRERSFEENPYTGLAQGMNVLYIQAESLQNTFVGQRYNGQEITPFLNDLIASTGTIYFDDYFELLGVGNTSDAEFVSVNGTYPTVQGQAYDTYRDSNSYGLAAMAARRGYTTLAFHGNSGSFYNRREHLPRQGFQEVYLAEDLHMDEVFNIGLSDGSLFRQMARRLAEIHRQGENFFALAITLSTHTPFDLPEELRELPPLPGAEEDFVYQYASCARYTDSAMREFFGQLEAEGILDHTLVVIYGDHHAYTIKNAQQQNSVTRWLGRELDYDDMMNVPLVIRIPGFQEQIRRHNIGSQVDLYPTVLNLLGWDRRSIPTMGVDLLGDGTATESNVVFPQTHLHRGSFITDHLLFEYSENEVFHQSRLVDRHSRKELPVSEAFPLHQRAILTLKYAHDLQINNKLMELLQPAEKLPPERTIVHGGGELGIRTATNMLTALERGYSQGKRTFEVDLSPTADGHYVGLTDWDGTLRRFFEDLGEGTSPLSLEEFMTARERHGWEQMDLPRLMTWLGEHPDATAILDTQGDNLDLLHYLAEHFPDGLGQVVVQIYQREEYLPARALGFQRIIYNLDRTADGPREVMDFAREVELAAITLGDSKFRAQGWEELLSLDVPLYIHTINDNLRAEELFDLGVSAIYTDSL